jgi:membrane protease subunit HflC
MRALLIIVPVAVWAAATSLFTVDRSELAYVTQFGAIVGRYDGATEAGLHLKLPWPVHAVLRLDRRLQAFDLPPAELPTFDPGQRTVDKMLVGDASVTWRVPDKANGERFIQTVGTVERARLLVGQRVSSRLSAVVSTMPLDELVAVAGPAEVEARFAKLRERLIGAGPEGDGERLADAVLAAYGVELVDVRLRRFNYPPDVRAAIAERIKSERFKKVAEYESEAERKSAEILSEADRAAAVTRSTAAADRRRVEKQADAEADGIRNEAHRRDPDFYAFLQKLDTLQRLLGESRDVLLLSARHDLFQTLLNPPRMDGPGNTPPKPNGDEKTVTKP